MRAASLVHETGPKVGETWVKTAEIWMKLGRWGLQGRAGREGEERLRCDRPGCMTLEGRDLDRCRGGFGSEGATGLRIRPDSK